MGNLREGSFDRFQLDHWDGCRSVDAAIYGCSALGTRNPVLSERDEWILNEFVFRYNFLDVEYNRASFLQPFFEIDKKQ